MKEHFYSVKQSTWSSLCSCFFQIFGPCERCLIVSLWGKKIKSYLSTMYRKVFSLRILDLKKKAHTGG